MRACLGPAPWLGPGHHSNRSPTKSVFICLFVFLTRSFNLISREDKLELPIVTSVYLCHPCDGG